MVYCSYHILFALCECVKRYKYLGIWESKPKPRDYCDDDILCVCACGRDFSHTDFKSSKTHKPRGNAKLCEILQNAIHTRFSLFCLAVLFCELAMQFLYQQNAGDSQIEIFNDDFTYIIKARRLQLDSVIKVRNLQDKKLYTYTIAEIKKKSALLTKIGEQDSQPSYSSPLHLLWAIIDPKVIEKTLPFLNELGISRISFFYAEFSQWQFSLNLQRMQKILISSCQQCGRIDLMELEVLKDFDCVCERYTPFYAFDFGGEDIRSHNPFKRENNESLENASVRVMVGAEGGFSQRERQRFAKIITLNDTLILRSESASVFLASLAKLA